MKRKFLYAVLAFFISFGLWIYVVNVVSPESEITVRDVPVTLTNLNGLEENGLMLLESDIPSVDLVLQGNRTDLNKLSASNISIYADLSRIYDSGKQKLNYTVVFPGDVNQDQVKVVNQNPSMVTVSVAKRGTKEIPVEISYKGTLPEGFVADKENAVLDHPKITITGPEDAVAEVHHARIEVDIEGRRESLNESYEYVLCDDKDEILEDVSKVETHVKEINLSLKIQLHKQLPIRLELIYGGGATKDTTKVAYDTQSIWVAGTEALLKDLNEIVLDTVDLGMVKGGTKLTYPIKLPDGVTNVSGNEEVNITITFPGLKTKELSVTNIQAFNIPKGLKVNFQTAVVKVTVRGPQNKIDLLTEEDLTIRVDFSGEAAGAVTVKAIVNVDSAFNGVGVVGNYNVSATLQAEDAED